MAGRTESIIPQSPVGASRKRDYTWPDPNNNIAGAVANGVRDRTGMSSTASGSQSAGTTGAINMGVINGVDCARFTNGVNIGGGPTYVMDCGRLRVNLLAANLSFNSFVDDYAAFRVYVIMRVVATPVQALQEMGLTLINSTNAQNGLFGGTGPGFALGYNNTGGLDFVIKGDNAAFTTVNVANVAGGFVNTAFHMAEFRVLAAQPGVNASIKTLLDGQLKDVRSWPNNLPSPAAPAGSTANGFVANLKCNPQNSELDVATFRVQFAPTEAALF